MRTAESNESFMPSVVRIPLGIFVAVTILPMAMILTLPFLLLGPIAAPFCLLAFIGDWAEERAELSRELHDYPPTRFHVRQLAHV